MLKKLLKTDDDSSLFLMRIALGVVFFPHGAQKLLGWFGGPGFGATLDAFGEMPRVMVLLIIAAEFFGSLGLLVGFLGRIAAFGISCLMLGAILMVHSQYGFFMNWLGNKQGEGFEYHILALGLAVALLIKGSGKWSLDRALAKE